MGMIAVRGASDGAFANHGLALGTRQLSDEVLGSLATSDECVELTWIVTRSLPSGTFSAQMIEGVPSYDIGSLFEWSLHIADEGTGTVKLRYGEFHDCGEGTHDFPGHVEWQGADLQISLQMEGEVKVFKAQVDASGEAIVMTTAPHTSGSLKLTKSQRLWRLQ